jgi:YebC/PmpR family DNA-binding regulatory protein
MSGHSKWATIKHKKAALDAKRGKVFTKIIKEITVAARVGGGDPNCNPRLRTLLDKARSVNMPLDNMQRAIKKGTGELPGQNYEAHTYEGYGPAGMAVIIEVLTDNKNKAVAELRHVFSREGGNIGETGSVNWMFERAGVIRTHGAQLSEDMLLENLLDYPVKNISQEDDTFVIYTEPQACDKVKQVVADLGATIKEAELEWVPKTMVQLDSSQEEKALQFLDKIEDLEDVQNVYANLE